MKKKKLIIIGAGGHSKSCLEVVDSSKDYKVVGFIDNRKITNSFYKKFKIYKEGDLEKIFKIVKNVHIGIAHMKSPSLRIKLFKRYKTKGFRFPVLTHSKAYVSKYSSIKEGTLIGLNSVINANCKIGYNTIINTKSLIEHDTVIGNHCHIATGVIINGNCSIGNNSFVGSGTIIFNNVSIGNDCVVGSGKIIKKNLKDGAFIR